MSEKVAVLGDGHYHELKVTPSKTFYAGCNGEVPHETIDRDTAEERGLTICEDCV